MGKFDKVGGGGVPLDGLNWGCYFIFLNFSGFIPQWKIVQLGLGLKLNTKIQIHHPPPTTQELF